MLSEYIVANSYFIYCVSSQKKIPLFDFGYGNNTRSMTE